MTYSSKTDNLLAFFLNIFAKTQLRKKTKFLPFDQKLKAIFVAELMVGAAFLKLNILQV